MTPTEAEIVANGIVYSYMQHKDLDQLAKDIADEFKILLEAINTNQVVQIVTK